MRLSSAFARSKARTAGDSAPAISVSRSVGVFPAVLLAAGLALLQALIGGRVQLFSFPGYCLIGAAALFAVATVSRANTRADLFCLGGTAVFFGYLLLRALFSPAYFARPDLFSVVGALAVYGLTVAVFTSSAARSVILASLLSFALVHVLVGMIQFSRGDNFMLIAFLQRADYGQRASGFYVCPNHLAGLLEVLGIFGVSLACWSRWPLWSKLLVGYGSVVCYAGVALSGSRGGYLSVMASLVAFGLLSLFVVRSARPKGWLKFGAGGLAAFAALAGVAALLIHQSGFLSQRVADIIDTKNTRIDLWQAALQQWQLQPVLGTGSGTYRFYGRQFRTQTMQSDPVDVHNDYLHLLCEYGVVGSVGFLLFFFAHARHGGRTIRVFASRIADNPVAVLSTRLALYIGALCAIAAYVVHSVVDFNLHIPANAMLLAFVFGIVANPGISRGPGSPRPFFTIVPRVATALLAIILLIQCARLFAGEYYAERARTALRDENPTASIELANKALRHEDRNPEIFFYLGRALIASSREGDQSEERAPVYERALAAFQEAHRLAPLDGTYLLELAFTYDEMGRFAEAEQAYGLARSRDPRSLAVAQLYQAHLEAWEKVGSQQSL